MKLDNKYEGVLVKSADSGIVPSDQYIVFLAKDNAVPAMLEFYREECIRIGSPPEHIRGIEALRERVLHWRLDNPELCKIPD